MDAELCEHRVEFPQVEEILHCIFRFLFLPTIQFKLTLVNKHWFHVINNPKFVQVYNMNANNILQYLNPNSDDDPMKLLFDWSELVIDTYPEVYEGLHMLRKNIVSVNILPADHPVAELASSTQMVLMGKDQMEITLFVTKADSYTKCFFYHYEDNNPQLKIIPAFMEYYHYDFGYGDIDVFGNDSLLEYLCEVFAEYLARVPKGLFWGIIELMCTKYNSTKRSLNQYAGECLKHQSCSYRYWVYYTNEKLSSNCCELFDRKLQYLKDHDSLLQKARLSYKPSICYRLMNNGLKFNIPDSRLAQSVGDVTNYHHKHSADIMRFMMDYGIRHNLDLIRKEFEASLDNVFANLFSPEIQVLLDYKIPIPSEIYYYMEERPLEAYKEKINFLRETIPDFYCPFGPTTPVLPQSEKLSGKKILALYHSKYSNKNLQESLELAAKNSGELLDSMICPAKLNRKSTIVPFVSELQQVGYKLILYVFDKTNQVEINSLDLKFNRIKSRLQMLQRNVGVPVSFIFKCESRQAVQRRFQVVFPGLIGVKFVAHSQENVEQFFEHLYSGKLNI